MPYKYTFDPIAATEYEDAFKWYEHKSVVAADNLILAVQDALAAIICVRGHRTICKFIVIRISQKPPPKIDMREMDCLQ